MPLAVFYFWAGRSVRLVRALRRRFAPGFCLFSGCSPLRFLLGTANSEFKIQDSKLVAVRCLRHRTSGQSRSRADGLATIRSSPPPGGGCGLPVAARPSSTQSTSQRTVAKGGCGLLRPFVRKFIIQNYQPGRSLRSAARSGPVERELRASAGRRLRPARPFQGRNSELRPADAMASKSSRSRSPHPKRPKRSPGRSG